MIEQSLRDKTVKGTVWSAADAFLGQGVTFIVGIVLARILSPEEYGLIGIVTIFTTVLTSVVDSGFSNSLILKTDSNKADYNTMFLTNMVLSLLLFILLFSCAPLIASFFRRPELVLLVRVMGLILIFQAFSIVQQTILTKRLGFKTKTKASLSSAILSGVIGIVLAIMGFGVWALVAQQLSKQFLYSILLWLYNKWIPNLIFNVQSFRYMWGFGWKLMASGLLYNIWNQLYQVVVGKCYSPTILGQYSRSKEYASIFSQNLTLVVQRVSYPAMAEIQDDTARMVAAYRKIIKMTMFVTAVCMISLGAIAEPLIYCLIGPQWNVAATFLPLICISMSLYPLHSINLNMLQIQGRSDILLVLEIVKKFVSLIPLGLGVYLSIYWMLIGSIFAGIVSFFLNSIYTGRSVGYSSWTQIKDVAPSYGIGFLIAFSVYFFKYLPISYWFVLSVQLIIGALVFIIACKIFRVNEYEELKSILTTYIIKPLANKNK